MIIPKSPDMSLSDIKKIVDYETDPILQSCHNSSLKNKVIIGSFALLLTISSLETLQAHFHPKQSSEQQILEIEKELNTIESYLNEIDNVKEQTVFNNIDLIDGSEIDEEIEFLSKYNETVKSFYKDQKRPFKL